MTFAPRIIRAMRFALCAASMIACLALIACADGPRTPPGNSFVIDGRSYDQVWNAAIMAVSGHFTVMSRSKSLGEIHGEKRVSTTTWGELVAVSITPSDPQARRFTITVDSRKRSQAQITGRDSAQAIRTSMEAALGT